MNKAVVLDSSALLCLLNGEAGADRVAEARAVIEETGKEPVSDPESLRGRGAV